ncbi:hypothetical protein C8F01DRAFT_1378534 [Mycena amicta]|nr:hypothetical protein C8F01DRAFT_1378534 [Mycena amicta]
MISPQRRAFDVALKLIFLVAGILGGLCSAIALTDNSTDEFISIPAMSLSRNGLLKATAVVLAGFWFLVAFAVHTFLRLRCSEANSTQYHAAIPRDVEMGGPIENEKPDLPSPGYPHLTYSTAFPPHDDTNKYTCFACDVPSSGFTSADQLAAHTAYFHGLPQYPSSQSPSSYQCIDCEVTFPYAHTLRNHMQNTHRFAALVPGPGQLECVDCPATFGTKSALLNHVEYVHYRFQQNFTGNKDDTVMPMKCSVAGCGIWFLDDELADHNLHAHKIFPPASSFQPRSTAAPTSWVSFVPNLNTSAHPYSTNANANTKMPSPYGPGGAPSWLTPPRPPSSASTASTGNNSAHLDYEAELDEIERKAKEASTSPPMVSSTPTPVAGDNGVKKTTDVQPWATYGAEDFQAWANAHNFWKTYGYLPKTKMAAPYLYPPKARPRLTIHQCHCGLEFSEDELDVFCMHHRVDHNDPVAAEMWSTTDEGEGEAKRESTSISIAWSTLKVPEDNTGVNAQSQQK